MQCDSKNNRHTCVCSPYFDITLLHISGVIITLIGVIEISNTCQEGVVLTKSVMEFVLYITRAFLRLERTMNSLCH